MRSRAGCAAASMVLVACGGGSVPLPELATASVGDTTELVARGRYLVRDVAVCGHCHAANTRQPDGPLSGGMAFRNWRLGTIRAANLTPDAETGIGAWSDAEVVRAIRSGQHRNGNVLAPVMPYEWFRGMSDRDALAIVRYLRTLPAVHNQIDNRTNLVFRAARIFMLSPRRAQPAAVRPGPSPEYGRYLANHVGLCADCHTPRGGLQAKPDRGRLFAGDASPPSGWPANPRNLTPDSATGIGRWSEQDFLRTLRTGVNPRGDSLHPFMPWRELRRMNDDDLRAVYAYLRTLPAIRNQVPHRHDPGGEGEAHDHQH
jgi:mono/diheme cytochrome c family protein